MALYDLNTEVNVNNIFKQFNLAPQARNTKGEAINERFGIFVQAKIETSNLLLKNKQNYLHKYFF